MHPAADSPSSIRWIPDGPSRSASVWRAVVMAGTVAVLLQAGTAWFAPVPMATMHIGVFLLCMPLFYRVMWVSANDESRLTELFDSIDWSPDRVVAIRHQGNLPLSVLEVKRHRNALSVLVSGLAGDHSTHRVTIWCDKVGQEQFRRLSVLAAWHAEART